MVKWISQMETTTLISFIVVFLSVVYAQPYAAVTTYALNGCNNTDNNYIHDLYLYPADGSCFSPSGGTVLLATLAYQITYNDTTVFLSQYSSLNCSSTSIDYTYPIGYCSDNSYIFVSIYPVLPDPSYWTTLGLVGPDNQPWQTILVSNYYSQLGCDSSTLTSVQVQGWETCNNGTSFYCQNGELNYDACSDASCVSSCAAQYEPLGDLCTPSTAAPNGWNAYLDYNTSISYQAACAQSTPASPTPMPSASVAPTASATPSSSAATPTPSVSPIVNTVPFVSFTTYYFEGCNESNGNFIFDLYLYPADGSCFVPAGGYYFYAGSPYSITYNETVVAVTSYEGDQCTGTTFTSYFLIGACTSDVVVNVYPTLPSDDYWLGQGLVGYPDQPWQTILVTNYYSQLACQSSLVTVSVFGWQECNAGALYYCSNGEINYEMCSDVTACGSGCVAPYDPLSDACTASSDTPYQWAPYIDSSHSSSYQASCVGAVAPSPSATPSMSPSAVSPKPSASPSPGAIPFVSFTTYVGCNLTDWVNNLYLYPADGSCFYPAGGFLYRDEVPSSYIITYNETTLTVRAYSQLDCSSKVNMTFYFPIGECFLGGEEFRGDHVLISWYPSLPAPQYWTSMNLTSSPSEPWEVIVATNYYSGFQCQTKSLTSVQVIGWPECENGKYYYCSQGAAYYSSCADNSCSMACSDYCDPLYDSCTQSLEVPNCWTYIIDWASSSSYQATCVSNYQPLPSATPTDDSSTSTASVLITSAAMLSLLLISVM